MYWNYTTFIESGDLSVLEQRITQLLEQEGCSRLSKLPELSCNLNLRSNYIKRELTNLWIICLFKGIKQWTVAKTFPTGFLCGSASGSDKSRLTNLTKRIKCSAFHLEVYRDIEGLLLESDAIGNTFLSGCSPMQELGHFSFYGGKQVDKDDLITNFCLINVPESFKQAIQINELPETKAQQARIDALDPDDPEYFDLVVDDPGYTQRIDLAFADLFDPNRDYWFIKSKLAYKVYSELNELESIGAKILYFKPLNSYLSLKHKIDFFPDVSDKEEIPF